MGAHPVNLAFRFLLEIAALVAYGWWGWMQGGKFSQWFLALLLPLIGAILWGTFAVPNDPSRSGKAPIPVPGSLRLLLELVIFAVAVLAFFHRNKPAFAWVLGISTLFHYALSYDRIAWLIKQ